MTLALIAIGDDLYPVTHYNLDGLRGDVGDLKVGVHEFAIPT